MNVNLQVATLIAAVISALGSVTTALVAFARFRRETARPHLRIRWSEEVLTVRARNPSAHNRSLYGLGLRYWVGPWRTFLFHEFADLDRFGTELLTELKPGEQASWFLPWGAVAEAYRDVPRWSRLTVSVFAEMGDGTYRVRLTREVRRLLRTEISRDNSPAAESRLDGSVEPEASS